MYLPWLSVVLPSAISFAFLLSLPSTMFLRPMHVAEGTSVGLFEGRSRSQGDFFRGPNYDFSFKIRLSFQFQTYFYILFSLKVEWFSFQWTGTLGVGLILCLVLPQGKKGDCRIGYKECVLGTRWLLDSISRRCEAGTIPCPRCTELWEAMLISMQCSVLFK